MNYNGKELTEGEFTVEYWGNTEIRRVVRVPRNFSLKFRGDLYHYTMLRNSEKVKIYSDWSTNNVELLKDQYGRLWLHVYYSDSFNDRIEEIFDFVENEKEADNRFKKTGGGPHYLGNLPRFFASENYDFILHEEVEKQGDVEKEKWEILDLNKETVDTCVEEEAYYELWGTDTFDGNSFLIKIYENKDEAEEMLCELEQDVLSQDESVRDTFWIVETSMEKIKERERLENEWRDQLNKKWNYDDDRLRSYVIFLVKRLMEIIDLDKRGFTKKQSTLLEENNPHEEDCYSLIALEYVKSKLGNSVGTKIEFRDGGNCSRTGVIRDSHEIIPSEDLYAMLIKIFETDIRKAKYDRY
jgi:hypothetical protein